jgi:hypothetical protein
MASFISTATGKSNSVKALLNYGDSFISVALGKSILTKALLNYGG